MAMAASREQPAQHIAAEWVWTRCRPRYSQMPASGSSAFLAARLPSVSRSRNKPSSPGRGRRRSKNIGMAARMTLP